MRASWEGWLVEKVRFVMVVALRRMGETRKDMFCDLRDDRKLAWEFTDSNMGQGFAMVFGISTRDLLDLYAKGAICGFG
jgi:hypothetical protein